MDTFMMPLEKSQGQPQTDSQQSQLPDHLLLKVANLIPSDWKTLGLQLGIPAHELEGLDRPPINHALLVSNSPNKTGYNMRVEIRIYNDFSFCDDLYLDLDLSLIRDWSSIMGREG